jgi:NAD+ diphosphatase
MSDHIPFSASPLDRVSDQRRDAEWVKARLDEPTSRFLPMWQLQVLVKNGDPPELGWARGELRESMDEEVGPVLLGLRDGITHFAIDISSVQEPEKSLGVAGAASYQDVRAIAGRLSHDEAGIVAQARSMIDWHGRHRFCAACGSKTRSEEAGYVRYCGDCQTQHFPRTDPVVIMLVHQGDRCLLGRQAAWPKKMFSALAGFVEPGESLEEAVRREVKEESDIDVGLVRYQASQPWPFPSSLMIGCLAEALSETARTLDRELEEAAWFTRDVARAALAGEATDDLIVPPAMAIAHHLIKAWVAGAPG